jgi:hypothetical protein
MVAGREPRRPATESSSPSTKSAPHDRARCRRIDRARAPELNAGRKLDLDRTASPRGLVNGCRSGARRLPQSRFHHGGCGRAAQAQRPGLPSACCLPNREHIGADILPARATSTALAADAKLASTVGSFSAAVNRRRRSDPARIINVVTFAHLFANQ